MLTSVVAASGLDQGLSGALGAWRHRLAVHDPAKMITDLAIMCALGGDCMSDVAQLRVEPGVYGQVASEASLSRLMARLGQDADQVVAAISRARAKARARVWALAGERAPDHQARATDPVVIDLDATVVVAHSDKQDAAPTWKKTFGFHPLIASIDHGSGGTGEVAAIMLRAGNTGSNTIRDHIAVTRQALAQLPTGVGRGKRVLIRTDGAGGTHGFIDWLTRRRLSYSVGFTLPADSETAYHKIPDQGWTPAYDAAGDPKDGADVAEWTDLLNLEGWPVGMRVIVRRERPHPGAQLRFDDVDGYRLTAFATNTTRGQLADLELRHRNRARIEDRIRCAKDTGLRNLPFHAFGSNQIWCQIVALATDLIAWTQILALHDQPARRWEPKHLRYHLFTTPATLARRSRTTILHLAIHHPLAHLVALAWTRLRPTTLSPAT
jgi:hypothetical protein